MVGVANNYHFAVSYSDNEGLTWHLAYIADNTRGWFGGMEDIAVETATSSPEELASMTRADADKWGKIIKTANIRPE